MPLFVFAAATATSAAEPEAVHNMDISVDVPTVAVAPRRPGRFAMRLPSLTYALTLTTDCDENWQANSVLISVADSRVSFDAEKLREDTSLEFNLQIPSDQIAPLRIENFCVRNEAGITNQDRLTVSAVLSAQGSLRCASEAGESIIYVSKPLDVMLECDAQDSAGD